MNALCTACHAKPMDHAIICPYLGIIASGRHKRIAAMGDAEAIQQLSNPITRNKRTAIQLRSSYWAEQSDAYNYKAYSEGGVFHLSLKQTRGVKGQARAISGPGSPGRVVATVIKGNAAGTNDSYG